MLCTALLCLADIMLLLSRSLGLAVTGQAGNGAADSSRDSVTDARGEVVDLALGFLRFAFGVLLLALALEVLYGLLVVLF
jgi:hypothetical protein